jgi:hypothetical protein
MPFLTIPLAPEGPLIDLAIALSTPRVDALKAVGLPFPSPVWVPGLIDTGANCSAIDGHVIKALGLVPSGTANVLSVTSGSYQVCNLYDVCIAFAKPAVTVMHVNMPVIEASFAGRKYNALIGRDLLRQCLFFYNGAADTFTLSF